ncbi:hypothetical protein BGZ95_010692 [Linnemannia exigua]|uniref:COP9 signalosome complex subunit 2 n=1 Tax=Linnemannia exigua TaxID=604196 RepID=A0AAD4H662_9FUNG|nr:hypothetical protein BGZ95_010692 [Linnemannia exigua]
MSDDDFMMEEEEDEDYDFDYEDEDGDEPDVDLENKYYNAKGHKEDEPETALAEFQGVVEAETEKGDWGFKALKQMVKLSFKMGNYDKTLEYYNQLLPYTKAAVTRNYSEKSINNILDFISSSSDMVFMEKFYQTTLNSLKESNNDRLLVKTNLKLAKLWLDRKEFGRLSKILRQLHASCQADDGTDDQRKGTHLLEIFALEIQMYTETKNGKKLKALYQQCLSVKSAIPHPRIMGVIRECGGKMHMIEKEWDQAQTDFFESFRNYDEAGSFQRIQVLKYLVLANMLMESKINPFDSQETKPYKNDSQIVAMTNLVSAYQRRDIREFEKILRENRTTIMDDPFIRAYIDDVLKNIRTQVLIRLIKPYTRIEISFISRQLNIPAQDVEDLLVGLILDKKIAGHIDQVNQRLELQRQTTGDLRYSAMDKWSANLETMYNANINKIKAMMAAAKAKAEEAKARALANAAILQQRAAQQQQQQQQQVTPPPPLTAGGAGAGGLSQLELIRQKKEALQARLSKALPTTPTTASASGSRGGAATVAASAGVGAGRTAAGSDPRAKGGLGMDMSPMISRDADGNLIINSVTAGKPVKAPSFATAKVNQKPEPKKELKILDVPEDLINPEKNPYFDENLAAAPRERRSRPMKFAQQGKYINIANQIRAGQRVEQLRREIEESIRVNAEEEDAAMKDGFTKREVLKGVEWWDAGFLPNKTYDDIKDGHARIETEDSLITLYVQHPVPIEPPNEAAHAASSKPRPLMLTTKERKRLRRQRRAELLKEKQDKIRLGLLAPDAPKVKLANMMRVLGQEAVLNPTEIEMKVRQQVQDRLQTHLDTNAERKLTHEERKAKEAKKKEEDIAKGIHVSLYKINDLSHPQKKFKVDKNATQLGLTGVVLMYPAFSIVLVEGGHKAIDQYKKLMLRRIKWSDNTRLDGTEVSESTTDNKCLLVWEGQLRERQFQTFRFLKATNDAHLKQILSRNGVQHYWDQALGFKEEDMLGAEVTL